MADKIKRGFLIKRYYCSACNKRVGKDDELCQSCGQPLSPEPELVKKAVSKPASAKKPLLEEQPGQEEDEEPLETEEDFEDEGEMDYGRAEEVVSVGKLPVPVHAQSPTITLPKLRTVLWFVVAAMLLWGIFRSDSMVVVAAALILVVAELEWIRRSLKKH